MTSCSLFCEVTKTNYKSTNKIRERNIKLEEGIVRSVCRARGAVAGAAPGLASGSSGFKPDKTMTVVIVQGMGLL